MSGSVSSSAASAASGATASGTRIANDFSTFLTLLTTQLQNQNPTDPMDANQMTAQLVQFASVEQQIAMNTNLENLVALQQAAQLTAAAPLIGRRAEVEADRIALQNGRGEVVLPAAGTVRSVDIAIVNGAGQTVRTQTANLTENRSSWVWDGRDASGRNLADGAYRLQVVGRGSNGEVVPTSYSVAGQITGAERTGTNLSLVMGGLTVGFDKLRQLLPET